jgi:energy-coupling factor transport system permease protein
MIKDITIGQYFPGNSVIHRLDSRVKLVLDILYLVILFTAQSYTGLLLGLLFMVICYMLARIKLIMILKSVKPILPLMIFTGVLNLFFIKGETPLFQWQFISIYPEGVDTALFMLIRVLTLIIGMSLLTYTTSPIMLTDAIERLLSPLKKIHVPVHELSMMMTIALRFIPTLVEETDKIMSAQKARGAEMDTGGLIKKAKSLIPVLIPLFVSAFKRANELATAMECRCYHGGEGRTRLKVMHTAPRDYVAIAIMLALFAGVIVINCFPVLP